MGVKINAKNILLTKEEKLLDDNNKTIGFLRSAIYSPRFKNVVGIAMIYKDYCKELQKFKINIDNKNVSGSVCGLPIN